MQPAVPPRLPDHYSDHFMFPVSEGTGPAYTASFQPVSSGVTFSSEDPPAPTKPGSLWTLRGAYSSPSTLHSLPLIANRRRRDTLTGSTSTKLADQTLAVRLLAGKEFLPNERVFYGWAYLRHNAPMTTAPPTGTDTSRYVVFDLETLRLSHEVHGGWKNIKDFGLSVAVTVDDQNIEHVWHEADAHQLICYMQTFSRVVGFNSKRFDLTVLSAYGEVDLLHHASLDLFEDLRHITGRRRGMSLNNIAHTMFGEEKLLPDGTEAVRLWRSGDQENRAKVIQYCAHDVALTKRILEFGITHGFVRIPVPDLRNSRNVIAVEVPVPWATELDTPST